MDLNVRNTLIGMYSKYGDTLKALEIFNGLTQPVIFSWTIMISRLAMNKESNKALHVLCERVFVDRRRTRDKFKVLNIGHLSKLGFFNELVTLINHSTNLSRPDSRPDPNDGSEPSPGRETIYILGLFT